MTNQNQPEINNILNYLKTKLPKLNKPTLKIALTEFCKYSICATILVYFVGTAILLLRNSSAQVPFTPLSIIQATIITLYFALLLGSFIITEYTICSLWSLKRDSPQISQKKWPVLILILISILAIYIVSYILSLFLHNFLLPFFLITMFYALPTTIMHLGKRFFFKKSQDCILAILCWACFISAAFIALLPMSIGGLNAQKVIYYDNNKPTICQEYDYYGVAEGLLVLKHDDKISLIPVGNGHIEYQIQEYSLTNNSTNSQPKCGTSTDSALTAN